MRNTVDIFETNFRNNRVFRRVLLSSSAATGYRFKKKNEVDSIQNISADFFFVTVLFVLFFEIFHANGLGGKVFVSHFRYFN